MTEQKPTNQTPADDDDDFYDVATSAFPSVEHLAPSLPPHFGPGRLVAIWALENGVGKGKNGPYPYTETVTLALDDGPNGDQVNDFVPAAPFRVAMRHSTGYIHGKIKSRVDAKNVQGVPLRARPVIGRVNTQPSSANKHVAAYGLSEPTEADLVIARKHKALIVSINKEVEAASTKSDDSEAFGF